MKKRLAAVLAALLICAVVCACGAKPLTDGTYRMKVTLEGGSGRASVETPAIVEVAGETLTATIVWSSPYYTYMEVDGVKYQPVQTEGGATFQIPVVLDTDMAVSACTEAMSEPHVIEYTLHFDSSTAKGA